MSMLSRLTRPFWRPAGQNGTVRLNGQSRRAAAAEPRPAGSSLLDEALPVLHGPGPRNGRELVAELQKNYSEVLDLVRKVSAHLDEQERRSERLMAVAERIPGALDALPEIRDQGARTVEALNELSATTRGGAGRTEAAMRAQTESLAKVARIVEQSTLEEKRVVETLGGLGGTLKEMAGSNDRLGAVLRTIQDRDAKREEQLTGLIRRGQRWMIAALVTSSIAVLAAAVVMAAA